MNATSIPAPRPMPSRGGLSWFHLDLRANALALRRHLDLAQNEAGRRSFWAFWRRQTVSATHLQDLQLYSRAVIVFAAMTVEAAMNTYGLLRFGEDQFELHFAYKGPERRLKALAKYGVGRDLGPEDSMATALATIVAARNRIAHARSEESRFADDGELRPVTAVQRQNWSGTVPDVLQSMDDFLEAFGALDPETASFFRNAQMAYPATA